jgi:hypothetical protein
LQMRGHGSSSFSCGGQRWERTPIRFLSILTPFIEILSFPSTRCIGTFVETFPCVRI